MAWIKAKTAVAIGISTLLAGTAILTIRAQEQKIRDQEQSIRDQEQQLRAQAQQAGLSAEQRAAIEDKLQQLRDRQNQLRQKQNQLRNDDTNAFAQPSARLSPFTAVRFDQEKVTVNYSGDEYELAAIDGVTTPDILAFCHRQYRDLWQKRFAEDLVVVLSDMGHPLKADHTVSLTLVTPHTGEKINVDNAVMTEENRRVILQTRQAEAAKP